MTTRNIILGIPDAIVFSDGFNKFGYKNHKYLSRKFLEDRDVIAKHDFDIIFYPDIQFNLYTDCLAMCRLGRVQQSQGSFGYIGNGFHRLLHIIKMV